MPALASIAPQRPLVIREEKSEEVNGGSVVATLETFLDTEAGVQAAPSSVAQQLRQLVDALTEQNKN
ncbi:hypothetical protein GGI25_005650 [Coemansia spiralis]|uniref:Uncharacterized protein n=2 Tax=Coemansia TaxID=4863 RepID=A0A9W8FY94_9FUNG|nr:hypothetical protein EDC05_005713 [Coemansia umbellata]KAJ2618873.1 hypothetical protein GGI26_006283 [Coemansia sp. RSA 1358]KAJ2671001.1 hypothetical protein GGI25_005650 [Coemansia spiralis]